MEETMRFEDDTGINNLLFAIYSRHLVYLAPQRFTIL